ncbi:unnamed protein product [Urochloa humidicola]
MVPPSRGLIVIAFLLALCGEAACDPRSSVVRQVCALGAAASGSALANNFVPAMDSLNAIVSAYGFGAYGIGRGDSNTVFGLGQCFRDLSPADCTLCFANVRSLLPKCYPRVGGRIYLDGCFGRYGNYPFFGEAVDSANDAAVCGDGKVNYTAADPHGFGDAVRAALANASVTARSPGSKGFGVGSAAGGGATAFALAQCWENLLDGTACTQCLRDAAGAVASCVPVTEGRALFTGCYLRYSTRRFWNVNATAGSDSSGRQRKLNVKLILIVVLSAPTSLILACLVWIMYRNTSFNGKYRHNESNIEEILKGCDSLVPKRYKYSELKKITGSFKDKLGEGAYGSVFKGNLEDGRKVAVKLLKGSKGNGEEFLNEVVSIRRTSHVNIVNLLGFCLNGAKRALIYEYMANGSLEKYIYSEETKTTIGWEKLREIAIGIARGLEYLHRGCNTRIIHFDIKPHNILLDEDFCPKIADFGLAKLCHLKDDSALSMAEARGTIGFIAPEVFSRGFGVVSTKSDVYSYGMMLLEMVGGRENVKENTENSSNAYFPNWIYDRLAKDLRSREVTCEAEETARHMTLVGLWCIQTVPGNRPSMTRVIEMLEKRVNELDIPPKPLLSCPSEPSYFSS